MCSESVDRAGGPCKRGSGERLYGGGDQGDDIARQYLCGDAGGDGGDEGGGKDFGGVEGEGR